jgi:NDP-sugar pyrophosphorylase family protein
MTERVQLPPIAILAGGLAKRMRPLTDTIPKAMIEVAGAPFIAHQLRLLRREGAGRVVLCLGYRGEQARDFVRGGEAFGLEVCYSFDGQVLLGTGGALRKALPLLGPVFFVTYGDSYLDFAWSDAYEAFTRGGCSGLLTVFANADRWDSSNVIFRDGRVLVYDKKKRVSEMRHIDYGVAVLKAEAIAGYPSDEVFDLGDVYSDLARSGQLLGYEVKRRFYEIGSAGGLADLETYLTRAAGEHLQDGGHGP